MYSLIFSQSPSFHNKLWISKSSRCWCSIRFLLLDWITFTSSSTVDNFIAIYGNKILKNTLVASIGPITSKTLRRHNIPINIEAAQYDIPGLIEAMEAYFVKEGSGD